LHSVLKKLQLLWIGLTLSLIFLISGFNFETFTEGSHSYYASEIVCSGPSRDLNCSLQIQDDVQLFRGSINEPTQLPNYGVRYTSSSFANFLNLFITSTDSLQTVILKIFSIKSLVAAYLVAYSLFLVKKFDIVKQLATKLFLVVFSFPYLLFGMAGVYPAPIATIAVIPILITLKVFEWEKTLSPSTINVLFTNLFLSLTVIMANRFETTAFVVFGIYMWGIQNFFKMSKKNITVVTFGSLICLSLFLISNPILRSLFFSASSGEFSVLSQVQAESSIVVESMGNVGLSVMAPVTFGDNSTRNLLNSVGYYTSNQILVVLLALIAWIPLSFILIQAAKNILLPLFRKNLPWRKSAAERIPALLTLGVFLAVPAFARTVWFFWYLAPLLAIFVYFTDHLENKEKRFKLLIWLATASNTFYFNLVVLKLGTLEVGSISLSPSLQIVLGLSLGLIAVKLVKDFLLKATVKTFNT
jgi:hypothetical protein